MTLTESLAIIEENIVKTTNFLDLISEYDDLEELDAAVLNTLVERIVVGDKVKLDGKKYLQIVTIHFRFVGALNMEIDGIYPAC